MAKTNQGYFFEDYTIGQVIDHAVPRTLSVGERALYHALYPARAAIYSSDAFARNCGLTGSPLDPLIVFHTVFGKTVPDISLNAVANLGYAEGRFMRAVYPGETLRARSEVIGLKENSNGKTGIVWVRTTGLDDSDAPVLSYVRWVMVKKRNLEVQTATPVVPDLKTALSPEDLAVPAGLDFRDYNQTLAGEPHMFSDYETGETIDHVDAVTVEEAEHMMATRLWQNTAKVHFDSTARPDGARLVYGGHVLSLAHTLSFNGLANAAMIAGINGGAHANPCFAGTRVSAWSEVLDKAEIAENIGALRLRLVARSGDGRDMRLRSDDGKYKKDILLDFDYWALVPNL